MQVVEIRRDQFNFVLPSMQLDRRRTNFISCPVTTDFLCDVILIAVYCATISWCIKVSHNIGPLKQQNSFG